MITTKAIATGMTVPIDELTSVPFHPGQKRVSQNMKFILFCDTLFIVALR